MHVRPLFRLPGVPSVFRAFFVFQIPCSKAPLAEKQLPSFSTEIVEIHVLEILSSTKHDKILASIVELSCPVVCFGPTSGVANSQWRRSLPPQQVIPVKRTRKRRVAVAAPVVHAVWSLLWLLLLLL